MLRKESDALYAYKSRALSVRQNEVVHKDCSPVIWVVHPEWTEQPRLKVVFVPVPTSSLQ